MDNVKDEGAKAPVIEGAQAAKDKAELMANTAREISNYAETSKNGTAVISLAKIDMGEGLPGFGAMAMGGTPENLIRLIGVSINKSPQLKDILMAAITLAPLLAMLDDAGEEIETEDKCNCEMCIARREREKSDVNVN